jgi:ADP-dependent NAD(P)H-hydrate dehydratase
LRRHSRPHLKSDTSTASVIDAGALPCILDRADSLRSRPGRVFITPHAGEMANLLGIDRAQVEAAPADAAQRVSSEFGLIVVMKGSKKVITTPSHR